MWNVLALERLNIMDAVLLAAAISKPTKEGESTVRDMLERNVNEAYPPE
jgi:hypothetical protein